MNASFERLDDELADESLDRCTYVVQCNAPGCYQCSGTVIER